MKKNSLKLENDICFPLYVCSKEIAKTYKPFLDSLGLTYTQYLVMLVLWESKKINVKDLGERVYLDSGTLTPLLKVLEEKKLCTRNRNLVDERMVKISLTSLGEKLKKRALKIPKKVGDALNLPTDTLNELSQVLNTIMVTL